MTVAGQVALVTGAGGGIGRSLAVGLASAGAHVGLLGRTRSTLEGTLRECAAAKGGAKAVAVPVDVTVADDVRAAVRTVERDLGPIDLLVNNAGRIDPTEVPLWEADAGDWWDVVETNVRGPMLLSRAVLPGMVQRGRGRIINVNSGFGLRGTATYSAYSVSKAALARLTDCLAQSLDGQPVAVFDLSPGLVRTAMTTTMPMWADAGDDDWTSPAVVVDAVLTLASGSADALSGRFLHAARDNLDDLVARAGAILESDARTLRLRPYGDDDPLA
ncbi:MAG: NAD(P)-dependent oxidoreductase [Pseudonocardiales bacterium]|nr:MAG: NAD(P)-dependent oxidoreductase [Pseudonocardiales bacterium]